MEHLSTALYPLSVCEHLGAMQHCCEMRYGGKDWTQVHEEIQLSPMMQAGFRQMRRLPYHSSNPL